MTGRILQNNTIIEVRQGDSFTIRMHFHKDNEDIDLTNAKVNMQVRRSDDSIVFDLAAVPIEAEKGTVALLLTPTQTNNDVGDYKTDIQVTFEDGSVNTVFPQDVNKIGVFRITEQVTR